MMAIASVQILKFFNEVEIFNFWRYFYAICAISLKHQRYQTTNSTVKCQKLFLILKIPQDIATITHS